MEFKKYPSIDGASKGATRRFAATTNAECVASEKVDGSNFSVHCTFDPPAMRYGRRTDFLVPGERMTKNGTTTWEELMAEMAPAFKRAVAEFRALYPEATEVAFFGELFGPGVLTRVDYGPKLGFYGFDIRTGGAWLDFDQMCAVYDAAGILRAAVLGRGTLDEMLAIEPTFESVVGAARGAARRAGATRRMAEGVVIVPVVHAVARNGQRCVLKNKSPLFADKGKPKGARTAPTVLVAPDLDERSRRAVATMSELVTPNRVIDVRSKHPVDISRARLCYEVLLDVAEAVAGEVDADLVAARRVRALVMSDIYACYDAWMATELSDPPGPTDPTDPTGPTGPTDPTGTTHSPLLVVSAHVLDDIWESTESCTFDESVIESLNAGADASLAAYKAKRGW